MHGHHGNGLGGGHSGGGSGSGGPLTHLGASHGSGSGGSDKDFLCESCGKRFTQKGKLSLCLIGTFKRENFN